MNINMKNNATFYQMLKYETRQFCLNTALHGYKYMVFKNSSPFARCVWALIIFISLFVSMFLLFTSWEFNKQNPIVTVADSVYNPIWSYHFPAVTICNLNKVSARKLNNFIDNLKYPVGFSRKYITTLMKHFINILYLQYDPIYTAYYNHLQKLIVVNNLTVQEIMMSIRPACQELLHSCTLKDRYWRCDSLFEEIVTSEGLCCSSNYYAQKDRPFAGYLSERYKTKPRRMSACGYQSGYKILINNDPEDYVLADLPGYGVKVLIHDPAEYPGWSTAQEIVAVMEEAFISVVPELTYSTVNLRSIKISDRQCVFTKENPLEHFTNYSHINCLIECRMNLIKAQCGCVPLFFWNLYSLEFNHSYTYACDIKRAPCVASMKELLVSFLPGFEYNGIKTFDYNSAASQSMCKCLPSCENNDYTLEASKTVFSRDHAVNFEHFFNGIKSENYSIANIYLKDLISIRYQKNISINWYSELAWFGGFLGLFLGFSFTSGFEILYYLSIRIYINHFYLKNTLPSSNEIHNMQRNMYKDTIKNKLQMIQTYHMDNSQLKQIVPPIHTLHNLKKTNNCWFVD